MSLSVPPCLSLSPPRPPLSLSVPQTVNKYNSQFHKLFQCVPKDELLMKGENGGDI